MKNRIGRLAWHAALAASVAASLNVVGAPPALAVSPDLVISQVFGGGGNTGAPYTNDFVELYNRGTGPVPTAGWSVQYASATGTGSFGSAVAHLPDMVLQPGQYLLVQLAGGVNGVPLPTPDATGSVNMAASAGKVALVTSSAGLSCNGGSQPCTPEQLAQMRDLVGYGGANFSEVVPAPAGSNTTALLRLNGGAQDTDNNGADFVAGLPQPRNSGSQPPPTGCDVPTTHEIAQVQGSGAASPLAGTAVRVEGVVTGDFQGPNQLGGFYLQDDTPDADPATSDGLFAFSTTPVNVGERVRVNGTAIEFNGLTELSPVTAVDVCGTGTVQPVAYDLPRPPGATFEPVENVLVTFPEPLTATEHFQLGRFGEVTVSADGRLVQPTDRVSPGPPAAEALDLANRRRLLIDDGSNVQNPATVPYLTPEAVRIGDTATGVTGVLSFGFGTYRLQPTQPISFARTNPRPAAPDPVGGDIRVASFNTLNYFTTTGDVNPNARGADNATEFQRQQVKEVAAITELDADVIGLMEVENNGATAVGSLVEALNAATGPGTYAYISEPVLNPPNEFGGQFGTDAIKVAMIYRPAAVTPVGAAQTSSDPIFDRPPLVQTFRPLAGGEPFTVIGNHFKSKNCDGATGADLDQGDGQSCYNARRVLQATALANLLEGLAVPNPLIVGDLNAYTEEDPIHTLEAAGYTGLSERFVPPAERYSYVFDGLSGELDHAMAGAGLLDNVTGATIWHINADEPLILDYNTEFNPPGLYRPDQYRTSDHDPLIIGLRMAAAPAAPTVAVVAGWNAATVTWTPPDSGGSAITGYTVRALAGGTVVASATVGPDARSHTFGGLTNGVRHTFEVLATNAIGAGPAGTATGTPFTPRHYTRLDADVQCPSFTVTNRNAFPVSFDWITTRQRTGTGVAAAGATVPLPANLAPRGLTALIVTAGYQLQDLTFAHC
jgi:uncharacterized protein